MELKKIAEAFGIPSDNLVYEECTIGHINRTYFVKVSPASVENDYVFQKVNTNIFKDPLAVMENIFNVTNHIRKKLQEENGDVERGALNFLKTTNGELGFTDEEGGYWRVYKFVSKVVSLDAADTPEVFGKSGYAFGRFQRQLSDFDASLLHETIPNFHNTVSRFNDFKVALEADVKGRKALIPDDIKFVLDHENICSYIVDGIEAGKYPLRVTHNDTKLNNLLFDTKTGVGLCVIDLDTVMPGSALYDFGDSIRFGASSAAEDEADLSKVYMRLDMFESYVKGFLDGVEGAMTKDEILAFPMAAKIITFEIGIRFLTDYLSGDVYFRVARENHNLDRARNQFKLVRSMEEQFDAMNAVVKKYI